MKLEIESQVKDPWPYYGTLERIDGVKPYNRYLWRTESWYCYDTHEFRNVHSKYNFGIVSLKDGRHCTDGETYSIGKNMNCYDRPCVYDTREEAIRVSAARLIRMLRRDMRCDRKAYYEKPLDRELGEKITHWVLWIVAGACLGNGGAVILHRFPKLPEPVIEPKMEQLELITMEEV